MARLTLYFCDLCKQPLDQELEYKIDLSWKKEKHTRGMGTKQDSKRKSGDICAACYEALVMRLEQEAKPTIPMARTLFTQSKPKVPPARRSLNAIGIVDEGLIPGKSEAVAYVDGDEEMQVVPSNFDDERRRAVIKELNKAGCRHESGFSMEDDGPHCKDCKEKVKI
jgi:hypothetical protein